jgi:hypothetical protein
VQHQKAKHYKVSKGGGSGYGQHQRVHMCHRRPQGTHNRHETARNPASTGQPRGTRCQAPGARGLFDMGHAASGSSPSGRAPPTRAPGPAVPGLPPKAQHLAGAVGARLPGPQAHHQRVSHLSPPGRALGPCGSPRHGAAARAGSPLERARGRALAVATPHAY